MQSTPWTAYTARMMIEGVAVVATILKFPSALENASHLRHDQGLPGAIAADARRS
jgi:hypothetical protein